MRRILLACLILATLTAPAAALFSLSGFRNQMIEFLIDQISVEGELEISVEEITDLDDGATAIRGLAISDGDGVWMTVESLEFAWNPGRLTSGEIEFSRLAARGVNVARQPAASAQPEVAPPTPADDGALIPRIEWPRSPLALRIESMVLAGVRLEESVLGHAIAFDAEGSARDEGDIQAIDLTVTRTDAVPGQIAVDYRREFSTAILAINLTANEGENGLIAALSGLPADAASRLTLTADGPPEDWRVTLELALADTVAASGTANISYQGPLAVDARFTASPGPKLDPDLAALLGEGAEIVVRLAEGSDTTIEIAEARITSPDLTLVADGTYTRATAAADLMIDLDAGAALADPFDGVDFGGLTFDGRLTGSPGTFAADGDLVLRGLETAPVDVASAQLAVDLRQSTPEAGTGPDAAPPETTTSLTMAGLTQGLRLDQIPADAIGDADLALSLTLTGNDLRVSQLSLGSDPLDVLASGTVDIEALTADLRIGIAAPDIAPVASAYGVDASGGIALSGQVRRTETATEANVDARLAQFRHPAAEAGRLRIIAAVTQSDAGLTFDTEGQARALRLDRIGPDFLPTATFAAEGTLVEDLLDLASARLTSPLLEVMAEGTLNTADQIGTVDYQVTTPDLGPVAQLYDQPASGALVASGQAVLRGSEAPRITGDLSLRALTYDGTAYGRLDLQHDVEVSENPNGELVLISDGSAYGPARIATRFALEQPTLRLTGLDATALGLAATGDVAVNLDGALAEGTIALAIRDLGGLRPVTGTALGGSGNGTLRLTTPNGRQNAALDLRLSGLATEGAGIGQLRLEAALNDLLGTPAVQASLNASTITAGDIALATATATVRGPLSQLDLTARAEGTVDEKPLSFLTDARANVAEPTVRATVSRLELRLAEDLVALNQPLGITAEGSTVSLRNLDLALPGAGRLSGNISSRGGPLSGELSLNAPDLSVLQRLAGIPLTQGTLEAEATFDTGRRRAQATVTGRGVRFADIEAGGELDLDSTLDWAGRQADVDVTLVGEFGQPVRLTATVPIAVSGGVPGLAQRGPVTANLTWQGDVGRFWALVPAPGHVVTGQADIDLGVTGDVSAPALTGEILLTDGGYQNLDAGTILTDLTVGTQLLEGGNLQLSVAASDGASGSVNVDGNLALDASGIDITTTIDRAVLVRRDDVRARLDGQISVKGPMTALAIDGDITITEAEVRLVNANPPSIVDLGEVEIKGAPPAEESDGGSSISLRIDVDAPGRMFVRGRGLDSEWKMGLDIRGTAADPRITGQIERVRGVLSLIGKDFELERGQISFDGGAKIDPRIDVMLSRDTDDIVGRVIVDGVASDPQLRFASTPSLPEDEVLPRTLFGKSRQSLTGSQAIQLALGLATLMDGGGGTLDQVRGAIGIDQLRIEEDNDGNAAVGVGKEVAEGIWVGTRQTLGGEGGTSVAVEVEVFEDIGLDAEMEAGGDSSVGIQWKRDF